MISERDILAAAWEMVQRHGLAAVLEAGLKVIDCGVKGDLEGQRRWRRIARAIIEMERQALTMKH